MEGLKRDYRQVKALLWSILTKVKKKKLNFIFSICALPVIVTICILIAASVYQPDTLQLKATEHAYVTSTAPDSNYFVDSNSGFDTDLNLHNCTLLGRMHVGLVRNGNDEGYAVLESIFNDIQTAYMRSKNNNNELTIKKFETNEELNTYVTAFNYADPKTALCFAMEWNEFNPSENKFSFDIRMNQGTIWSTRLPQYEYEESSQNQHYLRQYANTAFLQLMTTATNRILTDVYKSTTHDIQLLYMPFDSVEFENDNFVEVLGSLIPLAIYTFVGIVQRVLNATADENESQVQALLSRVGMRKSVGLMLEYFILLIMLPSLPLVCYIAHEYVLKTTSYMYILLNLFFYAVNVVQMSHLIRFAIDSHFWAEVVEISVEVLSIAVSVQSFFAPAIMPTFVLWSSFALPLPAITWIVKLGTIASNKFQQVSLGQTNVIVNGNDMNNVMYMAIAQLVLKFILIIWITPFKIYNDEKGSRDCLYLCRPSAWQACCKKGHTEEEHAKSYHLMDNDDHDFFMTNKREALKDYDELLLHSSERDMIKAGNYESLHWVNGMRSTLQLDKIEVKHGDHSLIDNLSLTVLEDELMVLIGENGTGKSSVLSAMAGLTHVHSGSATAFGINMFKDFRFQTISVLAYSEQDVTLVEQLTPIENIRFLCKFVGIEQEDEVVRKIISDFHLQNCANINASMISTVDRKKLSLAMCLISPCKVLLLDQPTSGMDTATKRAMWQLIQEQKKHRIIVVATQDMEEARILGDRICLLSKHAKITLCGTPKFFREKFDFTLELVFTLARIRDDHSFRLQRQELKRFVEETIEPAYRDSVVMGWNSLGQFVVKLPHEIQFKTLSTCVNIETLNEAQGQKYESLNVKRATLVSTFEKTIKDQDFQEQHNRTSSIKESFQANSADHSEQFEEARKISCTRATTYLIMSDFGRGSFWMQMLKLFIVCLIIIGQETIFITLVFTEVTQPILNYSSVESPFHAKNLPVAFFANEVMPDSTTTNWLMESFMEKLNTREVSQVERFNITEFATDSLTVNETMTEAAVKIEDAFVIAEEEGREGFAAYYFYEADNSTHTYKIGVYGNQVAAASNTCFGATMLETLAQKISGTPKLSLKLRNHMLPINHFLLPMSQPAIAEVYGVTILIATGYLVLKQAEWHGRPIFSGFHSAYLAKGGFKTGYLFTKYLKLVLADIILILVVVLMIYGQNLAIPGTWQILILWIFINPVFILANSNFMTLRLGMHHNEVKKYFSLLIGAFGVGAFIIAGVIAFSQHNTEEFQFFLYWINLHPPALLFTTVQQAFLYQLNIILRNQGESHLLLLDPSDNPNSFANTDEWIICISLLVFGFWMFVGLLTNQRPRKWLCIRIRNLKEHGEDLQDFDQDVLDVAEQVHEHLDKNNDNSAKQILIVSELQCINMVHKSMTDRNAALAQDSHQLVTVGHRWFGARTVKGVSFSVKHGERFTILGDRAGATSIIETVLCQKRQIAGSFKVNGMVGKSYVNLHGLVGYQPLKNSIDEDLTVIQHLNLFVKLVGIPKRMWTHTVDEVVEACLLQGFENSKIESMTCGLIRRLTLAMALIGRPKLVILDNPLADADPINRRKLIKTILNYTENSALLLATNDVDVAELLSDRIAVMDEGKFIAIGSVSEIIDCHGQGYSVEIEADMKEIQKLAPVNIQKDSAVIENNDMATQVLKSLQQYLAEKAVQAQFGFSAEFHDSGLLKNLFNDVQENLPYPLAKFQNTVLVFNLAMHMVELINGKFRSSEISIQSISYDNILLSVATRGKFNLQEFSSGVDQLAKDQPISDISVSTATLERVFARLIENNCANESGEKDRKSLFVRQQTRKF